MLLSPLYFLLLLLCSHIALALNDEGFALLNLRWSIQDDPEGSFSNWNSSDPTPCSWTGITCMANTVIGITIPKKNLLGSIPPSLGSLSSLRHLNLRSNRLFGGLPRELFSAKSLQSFVLYGNSLSGSLPTEVGNLSNLQVFDVSQNSLSGSVPVSLLSCKRLKSLDLGHNRFSGVLPSGIGTSLGELEKLDLSYNQFNGSIPGDVGDLSSLQGTLDFSHNAFSGPVPASLGNLPEKVYIDLTYNELRGPIPQYGALVNRGPTAFIGNPGLCGPPLKNSCSSDAPTTGPSQFSYFPADQRLPGTEVGGGRRGLSRAAVIAIVVIDIFAIFGIALVFFCCYRRAISRGKGESGNSEKGRKNCKECLCFVKGESGTPSENAEQLDLIPLDRHVNFDLDELLKASAFVLGKSGIGIVYKVVLEDGLTLAVRRLGEGGSQRFKEFQMEAENIGKVRHHNIVTLRAYYWSIDEKLLVYEYLPNGNLSAAIHDKNGMAKFSPPTWLVRLKIMKGVARGLTYLHEFSPKKFVHGDLKPNNILLGHDMEPKISDFGLGRLANIAGASPMVQSSRMATEKPQSHSSDVAVSPVMGTGFYYQAPEALRTLKPSQKWDVYSYGVMLLELITGRSPIVLVGTSEMDLVKWVQLCIEEKKSLAEILDPCLVEEPEEDQMIAVLKVALACVQTNPEKRPSMRHVLEMLERLSTDA